MMRKKRTHHEEFLIHGRIFGTGPAHAITLRDGLIRRISRIGKTPPDFGSAGAYIGPLLFDTQVNGAHGHGLSGPDVTPENYLRITRYLEARGVSHWIPTLVTDAPDAMAHACRIYVKARSIPEVRRAAPGLHLEGPCISPEDGPRGAHPARWVRPPALKDFDRLMKAAEGHVIYTTAAPEVKGAIPYIRGVVKRGVTVAIGHHAAGAESIASAVDAGARYCTHLGNGAASMVHRHNNPLWPQMADDRLYAGLIADLHHLPPPVLKSLVRAKTPERVILTSDCTRIAGLKPGKYEEFGAEVELKKSGKLCLSGTDLLAGSALMLLEGVLNAWRTTDLSLEQAFRCASCIPAKLFGVRLPRPRIEAGCRARFTVFDVIEEKHRWRPGIHAVFNNGNLVSGKET
jgi:N-acetylglucosamine-6-phosphate deacetylase